MDANAYRRTTDIEIKERKTSKKWREAESKIKFPNFLKKLIPRNFRLPRKKQSSQHQYVEIRIQEDNFETCLINSFSSILRYKIGIVFYEVQRGYLKTLINIRDKHSSTI